MNRYSPRVITVFIVFVLIYTMLSSAAQACKNIVACGDATDGDYNLLLKVRDPSRPGFQALCIVPDGYQYTYHHPWTGEALLHEAEHKFLGVATVGDTIPHIVKPGMSLNDRGIAFGDADTMSNWRNPTRYAWDDFDWIRYACERADDEEEAVRLMTRDVVDEMHASGVSENLFVVGPEKGFVIEADAFHYRVKEINDGVVVMSNYPKELWRTQFLKKRPIASSFDTEREEYVRKGSVLRLHSLYGVRVLDIGEDYIVVRAAPFFRDSWDRITVKVGERKTIGDYSVQLLDIDTHKARLSIKYVFKAWEDTMMGHIQPRYGSITVRDMMNWSRLHANDLDGLRGMCEPSLRYEGAAIYKVPSDYYDTMSGGWFAANHPCSTIYVPFHICNNDIYQPYKDGSAAELSLSLLHVYNQGVLSSWCNNIEDVFLYEIEIMEDIAGDLVARGEDVSGFFTVVDIGMQQQAWFTQQFWLETSMVSDQKIKLEIIEIVENLWQKNYTRSLETVRSSIQNISELSSLKDKIVAIVLSICESRVNAAETIVKKNPSLCEKYKKGESLLKQGNYETGFDYLIQSFKEATRLINGRSIADDRPSSISHNINSLPAVYVVIVLIAILIVATLMKRKRN